MPREYDPYIPETIGELMDKLASIMLSSPKFEDTSGYFPGKGIVTEFVALNEGLQKVRPTLGEERYQILKSLSDQMREHFEADPDDMNGRTASGRKIVLEMRDMLTRPCKK